MDIKTILTNMGLLGLVMFGMIAFIVTTQTDSNINNSLLTNDIINETYVDLESSLSSAKAKTASDNFGKVTPTQEFGELEIISIIAPTRVAKALITGLWNVFIKLPQTVLGVSPVVASLISSILLIFIIIGMWAIWKGVITS